MSTQLIFDLDDDKMSIRDFHNLRDTTIIILEKMFGIKEGNEYRLYIKNIKKEVY